MSLRGMLAGGLKVPVFALYLSDSVQDSNSKAAIDYMIDQQVEWVKSQLIPADVGLEGGRLLNGSLARLAALPIKYLTLVHNRHNDLCDSATDLAHHGGLTKFGKDVIRECERLGITVDVSHASDLAIEAVLTWSHKPVWATHSGCQRLVGHPRDLSDRLIHWIAESGGGIGVPFAYNFIYPYSVADHIDHIVQLVGPAHVAIGSDLDGAKMVSEVKDVSSWSDVVIEPLLKLGYKDEDVRAIAGLNAARILDGRKV